MPGSVLAHLDCASPYSYFALLHLKRIRPILTSYGITVTFVPVFLGGINHATGNQPPSTLPARARYGPHDMKRAVQHFQTAPLTSPPFFPMVSLLPQRCMCVLQRDYDQNIYETIWERLWLWVFNKHVDLAKPENMKAVLLEGGELNETQCDEVLRLATTKAIKDVLNANTKKAIEDYGAYGCPWLWVTRTDENGKVEAAEPIFGSDRWVYMYRLLGVEFEDVKLINNDKGSQVRDVVKADVAKL